MSTPPDNSTPPPIPPPKPSGDFGDLWDDEPTPSTPPAQPQGAAAAPPPSAPQAPRSEPKSIPAPQSVPSPASVRAPAQPVSETHTEEAPAAAAVARLRDEDRKPIGILGFSASGKTVYLSMLYHSTMERRLFPPEWHANWALDDGFTRKYLSQASRLIRGVDNKGRKVFTDETRTRVKREFPPGTQSITPIKFELYRKWGLSNRPLRVITQDGVGEAIHNAAIFGPNNLPIEHREAWESTVELCKSSEALLLFVNLVRFEQSELAPDVSFLIDWLIKEGFKPKVVAFVAPGLDAWKGLKTREELRTMVEDTFVNAFHSMEKAGIAYEVFLVSSLGEEFVHSRESSGVNVADLGQSLNPDPRAEPKPQGIDEPWEFIFRRTLPAHMKVEPLAVFFDVLWLLRKKFLNLITIPIFVLLAIAWFGVKPYVGGNSDFARLSAIGENPVEESKLQEAATLYDELDANSVWGLTHSGALEPYANVRARWQALLDVLTFEKEELKKSTPDYGKLVAAVDAYRSRYQTHPLIEALPLQIWRIKATERTLETETDPKVKLKAVRELLITADNDARPAAQQLASRMVKSVDDYIAGKKALYNRIQDLAWSDEDYARREHTDVEEMQRLVAHNAFLPVLGYQKAKIELDGLIQLLDFLEKYAATNRKVAQLEEAGAPWSLIEQELRTFRTLPASYRDVDHYLKQNCLKRYIEVNGRLSPQAREAQFRQLPAAITDAKTAYADFTTALAAWRGFLANASTGLSSEDRSALMSRIQQTLTTLDGKLRAELTNLESGLAALLDDPTKLSSGTEAAQKLLDEAKSFQTAYQGGLQAGLSLDPVIEARVKAIGANSSATRQFAEIANSPADTSEQSLAISRRLNDFAAEQAALPRLSDSSRKTADLFQAKGDQQEATERLARIPDATTSTDVINPDVIKETISQYNTYLAEPRYASRHVEAVKRRADWFGRLNQDPYYDALAALLKYPASSAEAKQSAIALGETFLKNWPGDSRAAFIRSEISKINPMGSKAMGFAVSQLQFATPFDGAAEIIITQSLAGADRELLKIPAVPIKAGQASGLAASTAQSMRLVSSSPLKLSVKFTDAGGTRVISRGSTSIAVSEIQQGSLFKILDDNTVISFTIKSDS